MQVYFWNIFILKLVGDYLADDVNKFPMNKLITVSIPSLDTVCRTDLSDLIYLIATTNKF